MASQSWTKKSERFISTTLCARSQELNPLPPPELERPVGWEGKRKGNRRKSRMKGEEEKKMRERRKSGEVSRTELLSRGLGLPEEPRFDITLSSE